MLSFNEKDDGLEKLNKAVNLGKFNTSFSYRIYGLKQEGNPTPLSIEYDPNRLNVGKFEFLRKFFEEKKIPTQIGPLQRGENRHAVYIGLRKDIRDKSPKICKAIIKTIILDLEKKLKK